MCSTSRPISNAGQRHRVQRVGAGQRQVAERGAALDQLLRRAADDRRAAGDRRLDQLRPVALLVPGQQVARQREQRDQRRTAPAPPSSSARAGAGRRRTARPAAGAGRRRRSAPTSRSCAGRARTSRASAGPGCTRPTPRRPSPTACRTSRAEDARHRLQHEQPGGDGAERVPQAGAARDLPAADGRRAARPGRAGRPARPAVSLPDAGPAACGPRSSDRLSLGGPDAEALVATSTSWPSTWVSSSSSPRGDGPPRQRPSGSNADAWQGQLNLPVLSSKSTPQPRCGQTVENALIGPSSAVRTSQSEPRVTFSRRSQASSRGPIAVTRSGLPGLTSRSLATRSGLLAPPVAPAAQRARQETQAGDDGEGAGQRAEARGDELQERATLVRVLGCHRDERRIARWSTGVKATVEQANSSRSARIFRLPAFLTGLQKAGRNSDLQNEKAGESPAFFVIGR